MGKGKLNCNRQFTYSLYVLLLLLFAYLLNQLDRYMVAIVNVPMAQEIHYGDIGCMKNTSYVNNSVCTTRTLATNKTLCEHTDECEWNYNGHGFAYQILAGPLFIIIYTFAGIPISFAADIYNRKIILACGVLLWSLMTLLMGFVKEYWHLAVLRFGQGIGQAGCTPFAASLITDYFQDDHRAAALGVYNWGIYIGYSMSFALGNFITKADINGQGWRWSFIISGIPGFVLGPLILFTLKEPKRTTDNKTNESSEDMESLLGRPDEGESCCKRLRNILKPFAQPTLLLLVIAGSIRNGAGYVWAYNTQNYFNALGETKEEIGTYMSWIPLVGGCIGVVLGGFISDRIIKRVGPYARLLVLIISQFAASPFIAGTLYFNPPWAYVSLLPGYIIGEMWVSITLAVGLELVPPLLRTSAVAVYLFVISNIGGNMPLLVPPIMEAFKGHGYNQVESMRAALYILYPGMYILGGVLFLVTMLSLKRDLRKARENANTSGLTADSDESAGFLDPKET